MANRDTEVNNLIINELTKAEFDSSTKSENELWFVTDEKVQISEVEGLTDTLGTKQDVISDLATIRDGASKGATALQSVPIARANVVGGVAGGNWLTVNQTTGKMECGELTKTQYNSALGYTFISKTTLNNVLVDKQDTITDLDDIRDNANAVSGKVSKSGDTMTGGLTIDAYDTFPLILKGNIVQDTSTDTFQDITAFNTSNNRVGFVRFENDTSGTNRTMLTTVKPNTNTPQPSIGVACNPNGDEWLICSTGVKANITNFSFPSNKYTDLTLGASYPVYTAPADGFYYLRFNNGALSNHWVNIYMNDVLVGNYWAQVLNNSFGLPVFPVKKGDRFKVGYGSGITGTSIFRFYYAQGEV